MFLSLPSLVECTEQEHQGVYSLRFAVRALWCDGRTLRNQKGLMSTKTGTILVIGLGHCWGGQANVSATHSDAHAPQIYTRLFWCMVVCETRCHQIHSTFPRGLPLLLVDRRIDFSIFFDIFLQSKRSCGVSEDEHLIPLVIYGWLSGALEDICNQQSSSGGQLRCLPHLPRLCFFGTHQGLSRLTSIYAEYGILLSTGINVYNDTTMAMENYFSR